MITNTIQFNITKVKKLEKAYNKALLDNKDQFVFENNVLLTAYAKYLIQYLETKGLK